MRNSQSSSDQPQSGACPDQAEEALQSLLTLDRLHRAILKSGPADQAENHSKILEELVDDIRRELETHSGELLLSLSAEERQLLWSILEDAADELLTTWLSGDTEIDPDRYYSELAWAYLRGKLPDAGEGVMLLEAAKEAGLRWYRFKRKDGPPRVTAVLSILTAFQPLTLLDIGSGRGAFLWPLVAQFPDLNVGAVDCLPHRIAGIEAVTQGGVDRVQAQSGDVTNLEFDDASFEFVTILEVLEHLEDPAAAAAEVLRVAEKHVIASVPSHEDDNPEHIRLFTEQSLTDLFLDAGAEKVEISHVRDHMIALIR